MEIDSEAAQSVTETQRLELLAIGEEALSNCLRHAQATQVWVSLQPHGRGVRFEIRDDGVGFRKGDIHSKGQGLRSMKARALKIGGAIQVRSRLSHGTQIIVDVSKGNPINDN